MLDNRTPLLLRPQPATQCAHQHGFALPVGFQLVIAGMVDEQDTDALLRLRQLERRSWDNGVPDLQSSVRIHASWLVS